MNGTVDAPLGALSFLSFGFSIIAAVLAIDMYRLLRTGEFGRTWRLLIIASVMLALLQVLRLAEILDVRAVEEAHLGQVVEVCFVMTLAYAFYCQRKVFSRENDRMTQTVEREESESDDDDDWRGDIDVTDEFDEAAEPAVSSHAAQAHATAQSQFSGADVSRAPR